ncbi:MAG: cardiolipin synthase [Endozoicomonas sp.]
MDSTWLSLLFGSLYLGLTVSFAIHVIMQRHSVGTTLSWLVLLFALPVAGFGFYLLFGSKRLGARRMQRLESLYPDYEQWSGHLSRVINNSHDESSAVQAHRGVYVLAEQTLGIPVLTSNQIQLFHETASMIDGILWDINHARQSIVIEFYIWDIQGRGRELAEAVIQAARRGVDCMVVLDGVGSRSFLKGAWSKRFRLEGISVTESMPVGLLRMLVERMDIRNHRKILVVDDKIAWSGSFNLVDPRFFKRDARVGQWVDAMVRIEGGAAHVLANIAQLDRVLETGEQLQLFQTNYELPADNPDHSQGVNIHVLPSGPGMDREQLHQVLLTAVYESCEELLISTPYFVPDESLLTALKAAAMRGVDVRLLVPDKNDSRMVHYASRSYYEELLAAGVKILQFKGGLLHTKCVLVDRTTTLFGTVNLDMRSVWLNFEVTLIIYDASFGQTMADLLDNYSRQSELVDEKRWVQRPFRRKLLENTLQLLSPLL